MVGRWVERRPEKNRKANGRGGNVEKNRQGKILEKIYRVRDRLPIVENRGEGDQKSDFGVGQWMSA